MADRHVIIQTNELYQSGVKGMKRGVRRWQNYDGSYTPAGRIHYGIGQRKNNEGVLNREQFRKARDERLEGTNPEKYSTESYRKLRKGKYKDLANTLDQEITEKRDEAQKAWDVYVDSGKHFFQFQRNREESEAAGKNFRKAYDEMQDKFFSISEKYIKEHFTKEQWDDARAFVYDHLESSNATYIEMD